MTEPGRAVGLREPVVEFERIGVAAFTTTRAHGDFNRAAPAPVPDVEGRWAMVQQSLAPNGTGLVSSVQVHGTQVTRHRGPWSGIRRLEGIDGHVVAAAGAAAITVADCVPVFVAHASGVVAVVHAGWRGTAGRILGVAVQQFVAEGLDPADIHVHFGPAICGRCYEVGPDVYERLTGWQTIRPRHVDLRALLAEEARASGVGHVSASAWCTRCDNDRFYSHRAGDQGRQIAVIVSPKVPACLDGTQAAR